MKIESIKCTKCGGNDFITMCKGCHDLARFEEQIRQDCAERIEELKKLCVIKYPSEYESGMLDAYNYAIDAILYIPYPTKEEK